jgi:hypothetical protein
MEYGDREFQDASRQRWVRAVLWLGPPLLFLWVQWYGLISGFLADDFAWLQLHLRWAEGANIWRLIFAPAEHGTWRPFSERSYFLFLGALFPSNPLPFRLIAYATQIGSILLLGSIMLRLTGSRMAAFLAPVFWIVNANLSEVMAWSSGYMQLLCGFCLLLAFHFLLRFIETGAWRYYWLQFAVFLLGFGVMETNLVYPALAAGYTLLFARKRFSTILPLFGVSGLFVILHMVWAKKAASGVYALHFDAAIPQTLLTYFRLCFKPLNIDYFAHTPPQLTYLWAWGASVALLAFVGWSAWRRRFLPAFFLSWFVVLLIPVLPLRDHISPYYLTLPVVGLAALAGGAVACAWRARPPFKVLGIVLAAGYLAFSIPGSRNTTRWWWDLSKRIANTIEGVQEARRVHPEKSIALAGLSNEVFSSGMVDGCFDAMSLRNVFLTPEAAERIQGSRNLRELSTKALTSYALNSGLRSGAIVVLAPEGKGFRDVTGEYMENLRRSATEGLPRMVDLGMAGFDELLDGDWYGFSGSHRWMGKRAAVRLEGPTSGGEKLHLEGFCSGGAHRPNPQRVSAWADGVPLGTQSITRCVSEFRLAFDLPKRLVGNPEVHIEVEVDRTFSVPPDTRQLGLPFGVVSIR